MKRNNSNSGRNAASRILSAITHITLVMGIAFTAGSSLPAAKTGCDPANPAVAPNSQNASAVDSNAASRSRLIGRLRQSNPSFFHGPSRIRTRDPDESRTRVYVKVKRRSSAETKRLDEIKRRLAYRYANPVTGRFLRSVSAETGVRFYREVSDLIDRRHLEPASYEARVQRAVQSLSAAVTNPEFRQATGLQASEARTRTFVKTLERLLVERPVRSANDALNMLYRSMDLAYRLIGLNGGAVALEFVHGATDSLDKYSAFEPNDAARNPSASLEDHVVGIGVEIKPHDTGVLVVKLLRGGPAVEAGLRKGDVIVAVNGRPLAGKNMDYAVDLIAGPAGSRILLGVQRDGRAIAPISMIRRRVTIHSVSEVRMLAGDAKVGYLKLDKFTKSSSDEMDRALWNLYGKGMQSLVIDVRGNPGGLLTTAVALSNKFLPCGTIVSTRGRNREDNSIEYATYERTWKIPLVVLVDENSASASEIFAAAIQENARGLVVGRKSYGKGTVQTHFPMQSVSGNLRLTTARYYSPRGRVMSVAGVTPDVSVASSATSESETADVDLRKAADVAAGEKPRQLASAKSGCRNRGTLMLQP